MATAVERMLRRCILWVAGKTMGEKEMTKVMKREGKKK
jgi:hypothetical protein